MKRVWDANPPFSLFTSLAGKFLALRMCCSLLHLIKEITLVKKACLVPQELSAHSLQIEAAKFHRGRIRHNTINFMLELASAYSDQTFQTATDAALSDSQESTEHSGKKKKKKTKQISGHTFQKQLISQFISSQWVPVQTAIRFSSWQILCNHYLSTKRMIKSSLSSYCFRADFRRRTFCPPPAGCCSSPPCHSSSSPSTYTATGTGSPQQGTFPARLPAKNQNPQTYWSWKVPA